MYVFRLVCEAQGEPAPDVFWTRENRDKIVVTDKKSGRRSTGQCGHLSWSRSVNYRSNYGDMDISKIGKQSCIMYIVTILPPKSKFTTTWIDLN